MLSAFRATVLAGTALAALPGFAAHAQSAATPAGPSASATPDSPAPIAAAPESAAPAPAASQEIVVTGSRLATGFTTPTPVTTLSDVRTQQLQVTNVGQLLAQVPAFRASSSPTTTGLSSTSIGSRFADLRGLGATHTLVLVNGQRFVPSTSSGTVDLNNIPTLLISRTEVVTGGASAAYGSGAVAGVINFILDTKLNGVKATLQKGISEQGDGPDTLASIAAGTGFADGKGHIVAAFELEDSGVIGDCYSRAWCAQERQVVSNATPGANGLPAQVLTTNIHTSTQTPYGMITSGPLKGTTFTPDGGIGAPFVYGQIPSSLYMIGGTGEGQNAYLKGVEIQTPVFRYNAFVHASYDFSDTLHAFVEGSYSYVDGTNTEGYNRSPGTVTLSVNNPFVPDSIRKTLIADGQKSFGYGRDWVNLGLIEGESLTKTYRGIVGLSGKLFSDFKWDGYYQYGHVSYDQRITNDPIVANFKNALNAVVSSSGQTVCAITLTDPGSGCSPINPFGPVSAAAKAYSYGTSDQRIVLDQHVVAGNIHGNLFDLPAGPVSIAMGIEHREDTATGTADALSQQTAFYTGNGGNYHGRIGVTEGYFETEIPVLANMPFAKSLSVNGAVRESSYSISGLITSWKVGGVYEPNDWMRLRVTRSRDIRAPSLNELYGPRSLATTTITDTTRNTQGIGNIISSGNPNLTPELGDTLTGGIVLTPHGRLQGLRFSVDYFNITLNNAISTVTAQNVVNQCAAGNTTYCPFVVRDGSGTITEVDTPYLNLAKLKTSGLDIEGQYTLPLNRLSSKLPGALNIDVLATYIAHLKTIQATGSLDIAGETGCSPTSALLCVPHWSVDMTANYTADRLSVTAHGRYIDSGIYDVTLVGPEDPGYSISAKNSINTNRIRGAFYLDLNLSYDVIRDGRHHVQMFVGVNNVTDKDPPLIPGRGNPVYFDVIGRYYKFGIRTSL